MALSNSDIRMLAGAFGPTIKEAIGAAVSPVIERLASLEAKLEALEGKGVVYRGVWQAAEIYKRGNLVTFDGGCWHCNVDTRDKPGSASKAWTLAVKGKDSR